MNFKFIKPEVHYRQANLIKLVKTSYEGKKKMLKQLKEKKTHMLHIEN